MSADELLKVARTMRRAEEWIGQAWLEAEAILRRVNRRPPRCRVREALRQLRNLRERVRYADAPPRHKVTWPLSEADENRVVRTF